MFELPTGKKKEAVVKGKTMNEILERIDDTIQKLRDKFSPNYHIENIVVGIEIGFPSGFTGTVQVTLKKK